MKKSFVKITKAITGSGVFILLLAAGSSLDAAEFGEGRVSQVFQDVRMLMSNAAARPAVMNDKVKEGTALRTGTASRAELTFSDLTITRLGENTIFSFNPAGREVTVAQGSVLIQVPPKAAQVKIGTAVVTAAISGGTMMFGTGPPAKAMVLEGIGTLYPVGHPEEAITLHGGEMATLTPDGHLVTEKFDVKKVVETSKLIVGFPTLENFDLILAVIDEQQTDQLGGTSTPPPKDTTDIIDQGHVAESSPSPATGPPSKFGPPSTISSPDPYLITNGTTIQTDPTITTNGVTDQGKLYRGTALDGSVPEYLFGEAPTAFDQMVFTGPQNNLPVAVFKFASLQLTGDPTVTVPDGGATNLALVSVGDITSGGLGGTLTFAGIPRLDFITQNGSITLGSAISFNVPHLTFYARGSGSNLTLGSAITASEALKLYAEGNIQVNGNVSTSNFVALSGGDFMNPGADITADNIDIRALGNITIDSARFPNPANFGGSVVLNATNTLNLQINGGGTFGWDTLNATANTINLTTSDGPTTFDFSDSSSVIFQAGTGGINAPNIDFVLGDGLSLLSGGSISVRSVGEGVEDAIISAATSFTASGDVVATTLTTGTTVDVGGALHVDDTLTAGANINVGGLLQALNVNAPSGILTVQGGIFPFIDDAIGAAKQHTFTVDSIVSPAGIDFNGNRFNGIGGLSSGGRLTINASTIIFDPGFCQSCDGDVSGPQPQVFIATGIAFANFNGADSGAFGDGNPAEGGNGGVFIVNTTGNITANVEADITATTGLNSDAGVYSGAGGSVTLHSSGGMVTINNTIEVSSDDSFNQRQSASGGTIRLQSDLTSGSGITLGATGRLLSLLNSNAPGPGGSITLSTMGADIVVNGTIEADRGTINIDQNDPVGATPMITIDGATLIAETLNINGAGDVNISDTVNLDDVVTLSVQALGNITTGDLSFYNNPINSSGDVFISAGQALSIGGIDVDTGFPDVASGLNYTFQAGTDLTIDGNVTIFTTSGTAAGGNISLLAGGDIAVTNSLHGDTSAAGESVTGANILLDAGGNLTTQDLALETSTSGVKSTIDVGGNITVNVGNDLTIASGFGGGIDLAVRAYLGGVINTGGNISIDVGGNLVSDQNVTLGIHANNGGHIGTGGNLSLTVGGNLTAPGDLTIIVNSTTGQIDTGGNLNLTVDGNLHVNNLDAEVQTYDQTSNVAGHIGTGGNIDIEIGGDLTSNQYLEVFLNNRGGGTIDSGGNLTLNIAGALNVGGPVQIDISNRYDDIGGNTNPSTIGSDVSLYVHAASVNITGNHFDSGISNRGGSVIDGNATALWDVPGNVTIQTAASWFILNDVPSDYQFTPPSAGTIHGAATLTLNIGGDLTTADNTFVTIENQSNLSGVPSGVIDSDATINVSANNIATTVGSFSVAIDNYNGGTIGGDAKITLDVANIVTNRFFLVDIDNEGGGMIGGNATMDVSADDISTSTRSLEMFIFNSGGAMIGGNAAITLNAANISTFTHSFLMEIDNYDGGTIGGSAEITLTAADVSSNYFDVLIDNGNSGGTITSNATINLSAASISIANLPLAIDIFNQGNGQIGGNAGIILDVSGDITAPYYASFQIHNNDEGSGAGTISSDATINVSAANISAGGLTADIYNYGGGDIGGNAVIDIGTTGNVTANSLFVQINNSSSGSIAGSATVTFGLTGNYSSPDFTTFSIDNSSSGMITSDATITVNADSISSDGVFFQGIGNNASGSIGGNTTLNFDITGDLTGANDETFSIENSSSGTVASDATINISAANINRSGIFFAGINNSGSGGITGSAIINFGITGDLSGSAATFSIDNSSSGNIGSDATIDINADNISVAAGTLFAAINNAGGTIGGDATINMNVSGTATANDATIQILGNDPSGSAAINFNGGAYEVTGTFFNTIDGDGAITFTNTDVHADVIKVGVFGANGTLNIGGGFLSGDSVLKLYAPGSNGSINFTADVTLTSASTAAIIAANKVTIFNGVTVTIGGSIAALVYTNIPNYTGSGGNGSTTGTFGGAGATTSALSSAPPFNDSLVASAASTASNTTANTATSATINISNSTQLLSLLDAAPTSSGGAIAIPTSNAVTASHTSLHLSAREQLRTARSGASAQDSATRIQPLQRPLASQ